MLDNFLFSLRFAWDCFWQSYKSEAFARFIIYKDDRDDDVHMLVQSYQMNEQFLSECADGLEEAITGGGKDG